MLILDDIPDNSRKTLFFRKIQTALGVDGIGNAAYRKPADLPAVLENIHFMSGFRGRFADRHINPLARFLDIRRRK